MKYKTELHCHSAEVSACANAPAACIVNKYVSAGYSTIVLTNHLSSKTYEHHPELDTWEKKVDYFVAGYNKLKKLAAGKLNIILGAEVRMQNDPNDYLVYGITEEFIRCNPYMLNYSLEELLKASRKSGFILVQAHPFRNDMRITDPKLLDGMEVYNAHTAHASRNDIAFQWACRYNLLMTSGSDFHDPDNFIGAGITTEFPITNADSLISALKSRCYTLIRDGYTF